MLAGTMDAEDRSRRRHRVRRYILFQIPGAIVVAVLLAGGVIGWGWSPALALGLFAAWVAKDAFMYRFVAPAYEPDSVLLRDPLIGARAVTTEALDPGGYVRVGAELWRAVAAGGSSPIPSGTRVRIRERRDLTLVVEAEASLS
jgi:membrane protein implicated in regulation of membrane protease activity